MLKNTRVTNIVHDLLISQKILKVPVPVERIAKNLKIKVVYEIADDTLSGFLFRKPNLQTIIGVNSTHHINRQRFTIAHEIGHFCLHDINGFRFDGIMKRDEQSSTGLSKQEREANAFAAELLMPEHFIREDMANVKDIDLLFGEELPNLAKKYKVSVRSLTYRLVNLKYLTVDSI